MGNFVQVVFFSIGLSPDEIDRYKNNKKYRYEQGHEEKENFNIVSEILDSIRTLFFNDENGLITESLLYLACFIILLYAGYLIATGKKLRFFKRKEGLIIPMDEGQEDIHRINFEKEIQVAKDQKEYARCIRLYYLWALKKMSDKKYIVWRPSKTNSLYLGEVNGMPFANRFRSLTRRYEQAYYGYSPINEVYFLATEQEFKQFEIQLSNEGTQYEIATKQLFR